MKNTILSQRVSASITNDGQIHEWADEEKQADQGKHGMQMDRRNVEFDYCDAY